MTTENHMKRDERILIFAPTGRDAELTARFLNSAGLTPKICTTASQLCREISGDVGIVFLTGETLTAETLFCIKEALREPPPWSDVPIIVLTSGGGDTPANADTLAHLAEIGNVTLIERPVRLMTLISTINSALRARRRQYDARDFLIAESESKEALRQSEERLRVALEAAHLGAWELDLKSGGFNCTDNCKAHFGLTPEREFSYAHFSGMIHPDDREKVSQAIEQAIVKRESYRTEHRVIWEDGTLHWVLASGIANYDAHGAAYNMVGVTVDFTERKLVEKHREELLASEQLARAEAESANRLKDEFLATVSHELRTPLNAMLGWTNMLNTGRLNEQESARAIETIHRNARAQAQIIEDLLDVSRIITGKLTLQIAPLNPIELISSAIETLKPAADAKNLTVRQKVLSNVDSILGDIERLQQVFWNLISNAIKFTPSGGQIEISLSTEKSDLVIAVKDTGQGIEPNFLPFVFDRFLQADGTTTRNFGGLGLGLAIVRHLVELHGGTVSAESGGKNQGATFAVSLPLTPLAKMTPFVPENSSPNFENDNGVVTQAAFARLNGLKILLVDDELDSLEMLKSFLEHYGAQVTAAKSTAEALNLLKNAALDVLISDIGMPEADGYQLIESVRLLENEKYRALPAVALTAYARPEDKTRALRSGFQAHLSKPVELDELIATVAAVVNRIGD